MGRANNKTVERNPSLGYEVFGFDVLGNDVNIPLGSIVDLATKASTGVSNKFTLTDTVIGNGSFTTNSLDFASVTDLNFFNNDSSGLSQLDFYNLLDDNKDALVLVLTEVGFEINVVFKIISVSYNTGGSTTNFQVELFSGLGRGIFKRGSTYTIKPEIERSRDFTQTQVNRVKDSVYEEVVKTVSVAPTSFEKGVSTDLVFTWNVDKKDDTLGYVQIDGNTVTNEATGVNRTYNVNGQVATKQVFLSTNVTRNDVAGGSFTNNTSATSTHLVPQYRGKTADAEPLYTYVGLSAYSKILSSSNAFTFTDTYVNQYAFIISRSNSLTIKDVSDFTLTIGDWASVSVFFIKKEVTVFLSDGTTETMYIYRTRETINATATFKTS